MKLLEFVLVTQQELEEFKIWWGKENKKNPTQFPLELNEGDWYEQFITYQQLNNK